MRGRRGLATVGLALIASLACPVAAGAAVSALSKKAYIKAADDLCRQSDLLINELAEQHFGALPQGQDPTEEQLQAYTEEAEPVLRQLVDGVRALPRPKGDKKKLKKIYNLVEDAVDAVAEDPALFLGDENPFAKADKAARKYGFKVCGSN